MFNRKEYRKQYYESHRQLEQKRSNQWRLDHAEQRRAWKRQDYKKNRDRILARNRSWRLNKYWQLQYNKKNGIEVSEK